MDNSIKPQQRSKIYWAFADTLTLINRSFKHIWKNRDQLLAVLVQPVMFMLLFRYVFGGAIETGTSYVNFLTAGILVQMLAFGSLTTSYSVTMDVQRGIVDRFKSLPMVSSAVVTGHVVGDLFRNFLSSIVIIVVAFFVGFRPEASFTDWLSIIGIAMLFTFAMSWVAAILGLYAKTVETVQWLGFFLVFPLTFASAAFVPTNTMPRVLRIFAENQPVTHIIEAIRAYMVGTPVGNHAWLSVAWCIAIIAIAIPIAAHLFRTRGTN